ncbi:MAG: diaminopimelate decarboxylase, partial [Candidatus Eremiobacteraeota bacterium]|nr:diaminopimelate decarboxylase [Candidatus Eremiobacteraeota bacterium]
KFGISPGDLPAAVALFSRHRQLRFSGLHAHIGSQIFQESALIENVSILIDLAAQMAKSGFPCEFVIAGGGFAIESDPVKPSQIDLSAAIAALARAAESRAGALNIATPRLGIEPGRALIARAGTSLYRVMAVKRQAGRPFVVVDGGIADNPRPALYQAYHHPLLASRESVSPLVETELCGRSCENDKMAVANLPEDIEPGDLIAVCITGAYTYSMASNYNRFPRPAIAAVQGGTHTPIARRENVDDILRMDCDA